MKRRKGQRRSRGHAAGEGVSIGSVLKSALSATAIAFAVGMLLILLVTAILSGTADPDKYHTVWGLILIYLTALLSGAIATRLHHRQASLFCGLAAGAVLLLILLALSLILPDSGHASGTARQIGLHALLLPVAVLGALLGARKRKERSRKRGARR